MKRIVAPRLDDRTFAQLRAEAIERIQAACTLSEVMPSGSRSSESITKTSTSPMETL